MSKFFGLPILASIILAYFFPYFSLPLSRYIFLILFLMMFWTSLSLDYKKLKNFSQLLPQVGIGLILSFVALPLFFLGLASLVLSDSKFIYGFFFSTLNPIAIVAPFFVRANKGHEEFSFIFMVATMLAAPFLTPLMIQFFASDVWRIDLALLSKTMILLTALPLVLGALASRFLSQTRPFFIKHSPLANALFLSFINYAFFGVAFQRIHWAIVPISEIVLLFGLAFIQDFGVYFLLQNVLSKRWGQVDRESLVISLSMKNVAISSALLLSLDPKASFASSIGFLAHAFFFNFLLVKGKKQSSLSQT